VHGVKRPGLQPDASAPRSYQLRTTSPDLVVVDVPARRWDVDSHAARIRAKLAKDTDRVIVNVWGVGYRFVDGELP
jgi:hypothetical protein